MRCLIFVLFVVIVIQYTDGRSNDSKFPLGQIPIEIKSVTCPDAQSFCPDSETCCQLSSGQYGCCPLPEAVCCNDHLHCCPSGYTCDVEHSRCQKGIESSHDIQCPGGEMSCADGETCCELQSGDYGCCPLPDAVCCSDQSHCCPHGYTCDVEHSKCQKGISIPWFTKTPASPLNSKTFVASKLIHSSSMSSLSIVLCPDQKSSCPEDTTCCELADTSYGCCPYPEASCCSDKMHCCGKGYSCDTSGSRCIRHAKSMNQTEIKSHQLIPLSVFEQQTCPDGITKCSLTSTCCPNKDNQKPSYSCCPYANGVCCGPDGSSCCPHKYICDEDQLSCQLNQTISLERETLNRCGSSDVACSSNETCCKISQLHDDQYACCAFPQGVCCNDGRHCCPKGTTCDLKTDGCISL